MNWNQMPDSMLMEQLGKAFDNGDSELLNVINAEHLRRYGHRLTMEQIKKAHQESERLANSPRENRNYKDSTKMPFGKHQGLKMKEVPSDYLIWMSEQPWLKESWPKLYKYVQKHLKQMKEQEEKSFWAEKGIE